MTRRTLLVVTAIGLVTAGLGGMTVPATPTRRARPHRIVTKVSGFIAPVYGARGRGSGPPKDDDGAASPT